MVDSAVREQCTVHTLRLHCALVSPRSLVSSPTRDDYQCPRWDAGRMRARSSHRSRTSARPHAWVVKRSRSGCSISGGRGWAPTGPVAPPGRAELRQSRQARLEEVQGPS